HLQVANTSAVAMGRWRDEEPQCEGMARTRCPRRCDGSSPVRPRGDRSLLASMGAPLDLHGRIGPHDCLYEKGPGTARTSDEWRSDGREATSAKVHHAVDVDRLHGPSCRARCISTS